MNSGGTEHVIEPVGTVFEMLAKIHGFKRVKENIYEDANGKKWHLTKYGFEEAVQYNLREELRKLQIELEDVSSELSEERKKGKTAHRQLVIDNLKKELAAYKKKLKFKDDNRREEVDRLRKKLSTQTTAEMFREVCAQNRELEDKLFDMKKENYFLKFGVEYEDYSHTEEE